MFKAFSEKGQLTHVVDMSRGDKHEIIPGDILIKGSGGMRKLVAGDTMTESTISSYYVAMDYYKNSAISSIYGYPNAGSAFIAAIQLKELDGYESDYPELSLYSGAELTVINGQVAVNNNLSGAVSFAVVDRDNVVSSKNPDGLAILKPIAKLNRLAVNSLIRPSLILVNSNSLIVGSQTERWVDVGIQNGLFDAVNGANIRNWEINADGDEGVGGIGAQAVSVAISEDRLTATIEFSPTTTFTAGDITIMALAAALYQDTRNTPQLTVTIEDIKTFLVINPAKFVENVHDVGAEISISASEDIRELATGGGTPYWITSVDRVNGIIGVAAQQTRNVIDGPMSLAHSAIITREEYNRTITHGEGPRATIDTPLTGQSFLQYLYIQQTDDDENSPIGLYRILDLRPTDALVQYVSGDEMPAGLVHKITVAWDADGIYTRDTEHVAVASVDDELSSVIDGDIEGNVYINVSNNEFNENTLTETNIILDAGDSNVEVGLIEWINGSQIRVLVTDADRLPITPGTLTFTCLKEAFIYPHADAAAVTYEIANATPVISHAGPAINEDDIDPIININLSRGVFDPVGAVLAASWSITSTGGLVTAVMDPITVAEDNLSAVINMVGTAEAGEVVSVKALPAALAGTELESNTIEITVADLSPAIDLSAPVAAGAGPIVATIDLLHDEFDEAGSEDEANWTIDATGAANLGTLTVDMVAGGASATLTFSGSATAGEFVKVIANKEAFGRVDGPDSNELTITFVTP